MTKSNSQIHYFNTTKQYASIEREVTRKISGILGSGKYIMGDDVGGFECEFSKFAKTKYAVGVGSGTDALIFALKSLGIKKGDQVITPSFTFVATVFSIMHVGAEPIFVDVDPETYTLDPDLISKQITKKTKAILPVHLYGQCADMTGLLKIARKHGLFVIEDSAQAHGAKWRGKPAGSMGDAGCFSFYPTKNLGAVGDGGIVTTNKKQIFESVKRYRNLGRSDMKDHRMAAWTSRLDTLQAAVLRIKLKKLSSYNRERRRVAARYRKGLVDTPLVLPAEGPNRYHVYHLFVILVPNGKRDSLRNYLKKNKIPTMVHYPKPVHRQPAYQNVYKKSWKLPVTDKLSKQILSLPIYPEMPNAHVDRICKVIQDFYRKRMK